MADESLRCCGIYAIRNTINDKCYIGSAENIWRRMSAHRSLLAKGTHHSRKLQRAWDKYGANVFVFELVEAVAQVDSLLDREQVHIDRLKCAGFAGYNMSTTADAPMRGQKHTEEAKAKIAAAFRGVPKKRPAVLKGTKRTPEQIAKTAAANRGQKRSDETRRKISEAAKARPRRQNTKKALRAAMPKRPKSGWTHNDESKAKMAAKNSCPVVIDGQDYGSHKEAAQAYGCHPSNIKFWIRSGKAQLAFAKAGV